VPSAPVGWTLIGQKVERSISSHERSTPSPCRRRMSYRPRRCRRPTWTTSLESELPNLRVLSAGNPRW